MLKPIKRHQALQPVSREHHFGLLLCWKIRTGLKNQIALERIKSYTDWFWKNHLKAHFDFEEKYILPILDKENIHVKRTLREHHSIKKLFTASDNIEQNLSFLQEELEAHIRFEERILFKEIQANSTKIELDTIEHAHSHIIIDDWEDEFWEDKI